MNINCSSTSDSVAGVAAPTARAGDLVDNDGGYYDPATRITGPIASAEDLVTRATALMAGLRSGGQR